MIFDIKGKVTARRISPTGQIVATISFKDPTYPVTGTQSVVVLDNDNKLPLDCDVTIAIDNWCDE